VDVYGPGIIADCATNKTYEVMADPCGEIVYTSEDCRSDIRVKKGIQTLTNVLSDIEKIEVKEYDWNDKLSNYEFLKDRDKLHSIGLIAQELREIYPEFVYRRGDGYLGIVYGKINAVLIQGIKEQQALIDDIDADIEHLKSVLE
jgi:hypothetical protein